MIDSGAVAVPESMSSGSETRRSAFPKQPAACLAFGFKPSSRSDALAATYHVADCDAERHNDKRSIFLIARAIEAMLLDVARHAGGHQRVD